MIFRLPLNKKRNCFRFSGGFTLTEMLAAVFCGSIILTGLLSTTLYVSRSFRAIGNYVDLDAASRHALDVMSHDIRGAASYSMTTYETNRIVLTNPDGSSFAYFWDPDAETLTRYYTNATKTVKTATTMLTGCDVLTFNIYQRNPTNDFQFVSTTDYPALTKLIDVSWRCSREIYGVKMNTESVQTARIVIRN